MADSNSDLEIVIGLEVHVQLSTKSKAFCQDEVAFGGTPNTRISPISLGHPGTLPQPNALQMEYAIKLGLALGCQINQKSFFDRKNYFYADLPKGYQITQDNTPICGQGIISIEMGKEEKSIRINRIHMEEDAGKSIHDQDPLHSLIDLNRAGTPLLEVVTEPDFRSAEEVAVFLNKLRQLVRYLAISDGNMEEGSMRCDCNISIRKKGETTYGNRCEVKNVNSIRNAKRAINFEANRQIELIQKGITIDQETRSFNAQTGDTLTILRSKEDAHDYRYFPDPDIPPVIISDERLAAIKASMPKLPQALKKALIAKGLSPYDAEVITSEKALADYYFSMLSFSKNPKSAANWLTNTIKSYLNEAQIGIEEFSISPKTMVAMIQLVDEDKINKLSATQKLFPALIKKPEIAPLDLATQMNLLQANDTNAMDEWVEIVLAKYPDKVDAYKNGKKGLLGMFIGEAMKISKGKANPKQLNSAFLARLAD